MGLWGPDYQTLPDATELRDGDRVKVRVRYRALPQGPVVGPYLRFGIPDSVIENTIATCVGIELTGLSVPFFADFAKSTVDVSGAVIGAPFTAGELRSQFFNAFNRLTLVWAVEVEPVQWMLDEPAGTEPASAEAGPLTVPWSNTISIAAAAVIALVGWGIYRSFTR